MHIDSPNVLFLESLLQMRQLGLNYDILLLKRIAPRILHLLHGFRKQQPAGRSR